MLLRPCYSLQQQSPLLSCIYCYTTFPVPSELFLTTYCSQSLGLFKKKKKREREREVSSAMANGLHLDQLRSVTEISLKAAVVILEWSVFSAASSKITSVVKNGYFHGQVSWGFVRSIHKGAEHHHSSKQAHLQTQAHSLLIQANSTKYSTYKCIPFLDFPTSLLIIKCPPLFFLC